MRRSNESRASDTNLGIISRPVQSSADPMAGKTQSREDGTNDRGWVVVV